MNLHDVLNASISNNEVLCIYCNTTDTNTFSAGVIQDFDEEFVLINHLTEDGDYDGYMLRRIEDIYLIEANNKYSLSLRELHMQKEEKHKMIGNGLKSIKECLLKFSQKNRLIVSVELCLSGFYDIQGFVTCIDSQFVTVQVIDNNGKEDGVAYIESESITKIVCDSEDERNLEKLYKDSNER